MLKSRVLKVALSPPAAAWRVVKLATLSVCPRSTCRQSGDVWPHHLSALPPVTVPFTAFSGPSVAAHEPLADAGLLSARFDPAGGVVGVAVGGCPDKSPYT